MICDSCGANYGLKEYHCPYCGSENPVMVEVRKEQVLKGYDVEAQKLKDEIFEKNLQKWTKIIAIVVVGLVVLACIFAVMSAVLGNVIAEKEYAEANRHIENLEELFQEQDWVGLDDYLYKKSLYGSEYIKYTQVEDVYSQYEFMHEQMENLREIASYWEEEPYEKIEADLLENASYILSSGILISRRSKEYINDRIILGNEAVLSVFYNEIITLFIENGVTMEEIEALSGVEIYPKEDPGTIEIAKRLLKNMLSAQ